MESVCKNLSEGRTCHFCNSATSQEIQQAQTVDEEFLLHLFIDSMITYTIMSIIINLQNLSNANMKLFEKSFGMSACLSISLAVKFEALQCFLGLFFPLFSHCIHKAFSNLFWFVHPSLLEKFGWWMIPKCISQEAYTHVSTCFQELRPQRLDSWMLSKVNNSQW